MLMTPIHMTEQMRAFDPEMMIYNKHFAQKDTLITHNSDRQKYHKYYKYHLHSLESLGHLYKLDQVARLFSVSQ